MKKISPSRRYPNGRIKHPTKAEREAAIRAKEEEEKRVVLSQPHRRGSTDQKCATALGRFVLRHKLQEELFLAGEEYASLVRRWRLAIANLKVEGHKSLGNEPHETTREAADRLSRRLEDADETLKSVGAYPWVRHIVVDSPTEIIYALPQAASIAIEAGLNALAVHFGMMRR